jgi:hypothetical protein
MSPKPKSLIPDTMVVIRLHELGLWEDFCRQVTVVVPSIIVHESRFYIAPSGDRVDINLETQVEAGQVVEAAASIDQMDGFMRRFDAIMTENLHKGEIEALVLLFSGQLPDCWLCSADQAAVKALVLVGLKSKGISLEKMLHDMGLPGGRRLGEQYSQQRFEQWAEEAALDRIQGRGLVRRPF